MPVTVLTVVGARPQFIKAAAVSRELRSRDGIREVLVHTGQHHDPLMSDVFFEEMGIPRPDHVLGVHGGGHGVMTGRMLQALEPVMESERPDIVLVYGDTNSTLAGALAAKKLGIRLAHVEAGMRSGLMTMPEEINRVLTDRISDILFCPSESAVCNLEREGFRDMPCRIVRCGDVMYDAALYYADRSSQRSTVMTRIGGTPGFTPGAPFMLCTVHRAGNTDDPASLRAIVEALRVIASRMGIVFPVHPRTRAALDAAGLFSMLRDDGVILIDPVGYFDMLQLLRACRLVATDSGGLQKEAYFFGRPCITLRDRTEWTELVDDGVNILTGASTDRILDAYARFGDGGAGLDFSARHYGDGNAAGIIADGLSG